MGSNYPHKLPNSLEITYEKYSDLIHNVRPNSVGIENATEEKL